MLVIKLAIDTLDFLQRKYWLYYLAKTDHTVEDLPAQILVWPQSFHYKMSQGCVWADSLSADGPLGSPDNTSSKSHEASNRPR